MELYRSSRPGRPAAVCVDHRLRVTRRLFYALGGGLGHLTRALALVRRLPVVSGEQDVVLCNSPFAKALLDSEFARPIRPSVEVLPPTLGAEAICQIVPDLVRRRNPSVLVVDTFPRGIVGELAGTLDRGQWRNVFVHRDLSEEYVARYRLGEFVRRHYHQVLVPGEDAPLELEIESAIRTAPWLLLDANELVGADEARGQLGVPVDDRPVVVFSGCGRRDEVEEVEDMAFEVAGEFGERLHVRVAALRFARGAGVPVVRHWPLLGLLGGIDLLVGSGGYHTVNEARATGTPLLALPRKRLYDRQEARVSEVEMISGCRDLIERIGTALETLKTPAPRVVDYTNGVYEAVRHL